MTPDAKYQSMLDATRDEAILEEQRQHDAHAIAEAMPRLHELPMGVRIAEAAMRLGSPYSAFQAQAARADAARRVVIEVTSMDVLLARIAGQRTE